MGCCKTVLQGVLVIINLLIFFCGAAVLGGGIYMQVVMSQYLDFVPNQAVSTAIILIVIGALIMLISFLGCCGSCTKNGCMLKTYGSLVLILLIAEIGTAIAIYVLKGNVLTAVDDAMTKTQAHYGSEKFVSNTHSWDQMQKVFKCCGIHDYKDWNTSPKLNSTQSVPDSCCKDEQLNCGKGQQALSTDVIWTEGCLDKFVNSVESNVGIAAGIGVGIGIIQLLVVIAACIIGNKMDYHEHFA